MNFKENVYVVIIPLEIVIAKDLLEISQDTTICITLECTLNKITTAIATPLRDLILIASFQVTLNTKCKWLNLV